MKINESGITMDSEKVSQHFQWSGIYHQNETKDFILIWFSNRECISIPKRVFPDRPKAEEVIKLIAKKGIAPVASG